jgi:glycosyltransferase 2 family protein
MYNNFMRKFLFAVILLLGVVFIIGRMTEVHSIVETLRRGDWRFLLLAFFLQMTALAFVGISYHSIYETLGIKEEHYRMMMMAAASNFLNIVAPSGGVSGMAVFLSEARRNHYSPGKAAVAGALFLLFDYAAFLCVLALGLLVLFRRNHLDMGEIFASAILLGLALLIASLIFLGLRSADHLGSALALMARQVNRLLKPFLKRQYLSEDRAHEFAWDASDGMRLFLGEPVRLVVPVFLALSKQVLLILVLFSVFLAYKVAVTFGTLIAGYSMGYLFLIVSPTPAGLGFVEGMLTLTLRSMFVPIGAAAVITLTYRGFTFWVPFIFGLISFRWLEKSSVVHLSS